MSTDKRRVKITIRMIPPQRADIESAARKSRMTVNDYALASMLARGGDDAIIERVKALLDARFNALAADLAALAEQQRDIAQTQDQHLKVAVDWIGKWMQECAKGTVPK